MASIQVFSDNFQVYVSEYLLFSALKPIISLISSIEFDVSISLIHSCISQFPLILSTSFFVSSGFAVLLHPVSKIKVTTTITKYFF